MSEFISPTLSYSLLSPMLVVFAGAIIGVLIEAVKEQQRQILELKAQLNDK